MTGSTRPLGLGLAGLGILLGLTCSVWSLTTPSTLGGRLVALMAVVIVVAPFVIGGYILYRRGQREEREGASFDAARQALERQRLAAQDWARRVDALAAQIARAPAADGRANHEASARLTLLADGLRDRADEAGSLTVLADEPAAARQDRQAADVSFEAELARFEGRVSTLAADPTALLTAVDRLSRVFNQRQRLLARGSLPPVPSVSDLLAPRQSLDPGSVDLNRLEVGDAVSYPGRDFLVAARIEYEDAGTTWLAYRLRDGRGQATLLLESGRLLLLDSAPQSSQATAAIAAAAATAPLGEATYRLTRSGTANANIAGATGRRSAVLVDYRRYEAPDAAAPAGWAERYDDSDASWTLWLGEMVSPADLDVFPSARDAKPAE